MSNELMTAKRIAGSTFKKDRYGKVIDAEDLYQVLADLDVTQDDIIDNTGLPEIGDPHQDFENLFVTEIVPRQDENGERWVVRVVYGKPADSGVVPPDGATSIDFRVTTVEEVEDWTHDEETQWLIKNARGDIMPWTLQRPKDLAQYIVSIHYTNEQSYADHVAYVGTVNENAISIRGFTIAPYTARCHVDISDPAGGGMDVVYTITVRNHYVTWTDAEGAHNNVNVGWHEVLPQEGFFHWDTAVAETQKRVRATDSSGVDENGMAVLVPTANPVPLALDGTRLAEGANPFGIFVAKFPIVAWSLPFD